MSRLIKSNVICGDKLLDGEGTLVCDLLTDGSNVIKLNELNSFKRIISVGGGNKISKGVGTNNLLEILYPTLYQSYLNEEEVEWRYMRKILIFKQLIDENNRPYVRCECLIYTIEGLLNYQCKADEAYYGLYSYITDIPPESCDCVLQIDYEDESDITFVVENKIIPTDAEPYKLYTITFPIGTII